MSLYAFTLRPLGIQVAAPQNGVGQIPQVRRSHAKASAVALPRMRVDVTGPWLLFDTQFVLLARQLLLPAAVRKGG